MTISTLFLDETNTLRSGWRLLCYLAALLFFGGLFGLAAGVILQRFDLIGQTISLAVLVANGLVLIFAGLAAGWLCGRAFEKIRFRELGAWLSLKTPCISFWAYWGSGHYHRHRHCIHIRRNGFRPSPDHACNAVLLTMATSALFCFAAAGEEVVFRGYAPDVYQKRLGMGRHSRKLNLFATVHNTTATLFS